METRFYLDEIVFCLTVKNSRQKAFFDALSAFQHKFYGKNNCVRDMRTNVFLSYCENTEI